MTISRRRSLVLAALASIALVGAAQAREAGELDGFARWVNADGSFRFDPATALEGLTHIGSWFVPEGDAAGFHGVYAQPEAVAAYRKTGAFPDGSVLVKELRAHTRADYTTGTHVASATEITQWFVMVKDGKGRFPANSLWGDGWGWALFKADAPTTNAAKDYKVDCLGCHAPARQTDWVYVQGYPALSR